MSDVGCVAGDDAHRATHGAGTEGAVRALEIHQRSTLKSLKQSERIISECRIPNPIRQVIIEIVAINA